jgi:hypothetical protein
MQFGRGTPIATRVIVERLSTGEHDAEVCPRCHRQRLVLLRSMARHSDLDWFKCDGCEHLFTRPRPQAVVVESAQQATVTP